MTFNRPFPQIAIDGIAFQYMKNTGIPRLWFSLLQEWDGTDFAKHLCIIDRNNTAPKFDSFRYYTFSEYDYQRTGDDAQKLQDFCDENHIDLFTSTYYTAPLSTPSVFMAYDMIPEVIGCDLQHLVWKEKHYGILHACKYLSISESTARDLVKFFPHVSPEDVVVAYCGVKPVFSIANPEAIEHFKEKYGIQKPYFLLVGERIGVDGYKNAPFFVRALSKLKDKDSYTIVCIGGREQIEPEILDVSGSIDIKRFSLEDEEMRAAYSGAIALVYPSLYEGFGLPIAEAMSCGCPVISSPVSSIPEVGGDAILYVNPDRVDELTAALIAVQQPEIRQQVVAKGLIQAKQFTWEHSAQVVANTLIQTSEQLRYLTPRADAALWGHFRKLQSEVQPLHIALDQTQRQLNKSNRQLRRTQNRLEETQRELVEAQRQVEAMETSKFWQLRGAWFKLKRKVGLPVR